MAWLFGKDIWRRKDSGQVLIVAALSIALIIISTVAYVYELGAVNSSIDSAPLCDYVLMVESGTRKLMIRSLANVTYSHVKENLNSDLQRWRRLLSEQYVFGKCLLEYELANNGFYESGIWVSWTSNIGVSSAYGFFDLAISDRNVEVTQTFSLNISTVLGVEGEYARLGGDNKSATILVKLQNEDTPALASAIQVFYENLGEWHETSYLLTDYGNGTYRVNFTAAIQTDPVRVSVRVVDRRDIVVQANATLTET